MKKTTRQSRFEQVVEHVNSMTAEFPSVKMSELASAALSLSPKHTEMTLTFGAQTFTINREGTGYFCYRLHTTPTELAKVAAEDLKATVAALAAEAKLEDMYLAVIDGKVWGTPSTYIPVEHKTVAASVAPMAESFRYSMTSPDQMRLVFSSEAMAARETHIRFGAMVRNGMTGTASFSVSAVLYTAKGRLWRIESLGDRTRHIDAGRISQVNEAIEATINYEEATAVVDYLAHTTIGLPRETVTELIGEPTEREQKLIEKLPESELTADELVERMIDLGFPDRAISALYGEISKWLEHDRTTEHAA